MAAMPAAYPSAPAFRLVYAQSTWCSAACPSFFSSPFGGNSAWRPREPQTQPEKKPQDEADKERTTWTPTEY